ncbi:uncharacterized protein METZ01_LOCUS321461 [marine metagenome]|uniref:acylphosphatase n=1 Tax=marine metagenome TaxID=408172 RepID=A0A382P710_9ZZZZ
MTIDTRTVSFKITGKVQGVWFRAYSRDSALSLNIDGWVKNDPDGSVFGEAVGSEKNMKKFVNVLRKGSPNSRVEDVFVEESPETGHYSGFEIRF